jgi:hypothetical protein
VHCFETPVSGVDCESNALFSVIKKFRNKLAYFNSATVYSNKRMTKTCLFATQMPTAAIFMAFSPIRTFRHQNPSLLLSVTCLMLTYLAAIFSSLGACLIDEIQTLARADSFEALYCRILFCLCIFLSDAAWALYCSLALYCSFNNPACFVPG